jgi:hypothetical protein
LSIVSVSHSGFSRPVESDSVEANAAIIVDSIRTIGLRERPDRHHQRQQIGR